VAPRAFVNNLWQAALHDGRVSTLICPSCMRPFTRLVGPRANARLEVCVGCFWVWLGPRALSALSSPTTGLPALAPGKAVVRRTVVSESARAPAEPRHVLGVLTADVLRGVL
jgi:hypothetical protein